MIATASLRICGSWQATLMAGARSADRAWPILLGPRRGLRWIPQAHTPAAWLGLEDAEMTRALAGLVADGSVFYDVGAGAGYHTLLAARLAGPGGAVYSFESNPRELSYLHDHVRCNRADNVRVFPGSEYWNLDKLSRSRGLAPADVIRLGATGRLADMLNGCLDLLERNRPAVVAQVRPGEHTGCARLLTLAGYRLRPEKSGCDFLVATPSL